jgi:hypothetical protein
MRKTRRRETRPGKGFQLLFRPEELVTSGSRREAKQEHTMKAKASPQEPTRVRIALLNEDLAREYQAIISYVVYSQVDLPLKFSPVSSSHTGQ